jgi:Luciferase
MQRFEIEFLPTRPGPRPITSSIPPHIQLNQYAPQEIVGQLLMRSLALDFVRRKESRLASPETIALWIPDEKAGGPREAFLDDHEFCHIHPSEGMIHMTLPDGIRQTAISRAWCEQHAIAQAGLIAKTTVLAYAPRNREELEIVCKLVRASYEFACGKTRWPSEHSGRLV